MRHVAKLPVLPVPLALLLQPLPLFPLRLALQRVAKALNGRMGGLFARLGTHAGKTFLVDPTDFPFVFRLRLSPGESTIEPRRRKQAGPWDARIAGPLAALIGMACGVHDGDALFFSRDIVIGGDTEAVLALRNALDDAEIDLGPEMVGALGLPSAIARPVAHRILPPLYRLIAF